VYISNYYRRLKAVFLVFILFFFFCVVRLLFIQFFRASYLTVIARKQHNLLVELEPRRGTIFDANLKAQAINLAVDSVYAAPNELKDSERDVIIKQVTTV